MRTDVSKELRRRSETDVKTPRSRSLTPRRTAARDILDREEMPVLISDTMQARRTIVASVLTLVMVVLNGACLCLSKAGAEQENASAPATHACCPDRDDASAPRQCHARPHPSSAPACPHCDNSQVAELRTHISAGLPTDLQIAAHPFLSRTTAPSPLAAVLLRPIGVINGPPPLAVLRQTCVLLI